MSSVSSVDLATKGGKTYHDTIFAMIQRALPTYMKLRPNQREEHGAERGWRCAEYALSHLDFVWQFQFLCSSLFVAVAQWERLFNRL